MTTVLREHAEQQYAEELARPGPRRHAHAPAALEALALGRGDLPAGRQARQRLRRSRPSTSAAAA